MVQSHILFALALCFGLTLEPQEPPKSDLPNPFSLKAEEFKAGNPLARFIEMVRMEKQYAADAMWNSSYWQARSTLASQLGDIVEAEKSWSLGFQPGKHPLMVRSSLEGKTPMSAVEVIVKAADRHSWIMFGEEHVRPQTRSILPQLLRELRKKGFSVLAVETLNEDLAATTRQGYADYSTGTYTADPVFAAGIREALRLGYKLVPYEHVERPAEVPPGDIHFLQNFRESGQARKLKERIFDKDPKAKVIVWAGRAHVLETSVKDEQGEWTPMAYEFKRMTGIDPFSVYLSSYTEAIDRSREWPLYKWATDRGLVTKPTIFMGKDGKAHGSSFDADVFFPRTSYIKGRPDWLVREMGRQPVDIPTGLVKGTGTQLVQAFGMGEPVTAVPVDQTLLRAGEALPVLMLPSGRYSVRVIDAEGEASELTPLTVR